MASKIAGFTYYGERTSDNMEVSLWAFQDGTYSIVVEGYPELEQRRLSYNKAIGVLNDFKNSSEKDWGSSDIEWLKRRSSGE